MLRLVAKAFSRLTGPSSFGAGSWMSLPSDAVEEDSVCPTVIAGREIKITTSTAAIIQIIKLVPIVNLCFIFLTSLPPRLASIDAEAGKSIFRTINYLPNYYTIDTAVLEMNIKLESAEKN